MRKLPPLLPCRPLAIAAAALAITGCSYLPTADTVLGVVTPYRIDIVQGNVVTKEQMDRIKPGLTRLQVRDVLGTPLVTDLFHDGRWDYVFTIRRQGTEPQRISIVLRFEGDQLQTIEAPELPSEQEFVASITPNKRFSKRQLALTDEQRRALPSPRPPELPTAEAFRPERDYPPLEAGQLRREPPPLEPPAAPAPSN